MGHQRHVIKRQTVEITLADKEAAWPLQQTLSRLFQQHFPVILDRYLSAFSPADCLHRIDCLELDLGELDSSRLEADILEKAGASLQKALREHIGNAQVAQKARQGEKKRAHLQLFEQFVREGYLPWWADNTQKHAPENSLAALLNSDPKALAQRLVKLIQEPGCLRRMISYFDDEHLIAMLALLTAAPKDLATSLLQTLLAVKAPLQQSTTLPASRIKFTLWQSLLQVAASGEPAISSHAGFLMAVTVRWAKLQGLPHSTLAACLQEIAASASAGNNHWLQAIIGLSTPLAGTSVMPDEQQRSSQHDETHKKPRPEQPESQSKSVTEDTIRPPEIPLAKNTIAPKEQTGIESTDPNQSFGDTDAMGINEDMASTSEIPLTQNTISPEDQRGIESTDDNPTFSETDALYISNAGLCILWPYLGTFFERLELVQNGRFHNQVAQQCAVSLLHYLATGELNPPEYLLPFNKLLCALTIEEVFDFDTPLTDAQQAACDELLSAVIANAPILNNMSLNGFRGSFLLRQGSLSAEAGSWLLRVERETYDLVLDRFPWTWQWFKLPWMDYPIRVEW